MHANSLMPVGIFRRKKSRDDGLLPVPPPAEADLEPESAGSVETAAVLHSADSPIDHPDADALGRNAFARSIAIDVRHAPKASGFVIGLAGPWGSGKTSIQKLVQHELKDEVTAVVTFNPWLFSGTEQLVGHFFAELAGQLELAGQIEKDGRDRLRQIAGSLSKYGRLVSPLRYAPLVGGIAGLASDAAGALGDTLRSEDLSAEIQAKELRKDLLPLDKPILVLIDDLDRLRPEEIVDVVRLIRLVGDFPNLVYIVSFDQGVVEAALDTQGNRGREYLEKIIHVLHNVPAVQHEDLTVVLEEALAEAIPDPSSHRFDQQRFRSLFWDDVRPYFETVRDVRRFINMLRSSVDLLGDEVDLADLLALEALRLFEPGAFAEIVKARYVLTGSSDPLDPAYSRLFLDRSEAASEAKVKAIVEAASDPDRVEHITRELFPLGEKHLGGMEYSDRAFRSEWRTQFRVASSDVLDVYLSRRLAPGAMPAREFEDILSLFSDKPALARALNELDEKSLRSLYVRLADLKGNHSPAEVRNAMEVVMERGAGFGDTFADTYGSLLLRSLLRSLSPEDIPGVFRELAYPDRSRQFELLRAVSYRPERYARMIPEADAVLLGSEFRDEILSGEGVDLVGEADFAPLLGYLESEDRDRLIDRLPIWLTDQTFLVRFVTAHSFEKVGASSERIVQLDWPTLCDVLNAANSMDRLKDVDDAWVESSFDDKTRTLWRQALAYLDDPAAAERDLAGWPTRDI